MGSRFGAVAAILPLLLGGCESEVLLSGPGDAADVTNDVGALPDADADTGVRADEGDDAADEVGDACLPVAELCDSADNDCDGETDEDFDLASDPDNCGACGAVCRPDHATGGCADGMCGYACDDGWVDLNGSPVDGCEYPCTPTAYAEWPDDGTCEDGLDNDCDGRSDWADDCGTPPEFCNYMDDDCDGLTDEDFDLDFDPLNCGECGNECPTSLGMIPVCVLGECDLRCDGSGSPPCECIPSVDPTEIECDGVDDDCDGLTDEHFVPATTCGTGWCERGPICHRGVVMPCVPRPPPTDHDYNCDGVDDDCDGLTDEDCPPGG